MIIATGNTYNVKDDLKKVGFIFDRNTQEWTAFNFDRVAWETKYCSPTWNGRKSATMCQSIDIAEV